jgi:excisionase family DNA binding protein
MNDDRLPTEANASDFPSDPIKPGEAAKLLGVSPRCIWRWVAQERLRGWKVGRGLRVSRAEVLALPKPVTRPERVPPRARAGLAPWVASLEAAGFRVGPE